MIAINTVERKIVEKIIKRHIPHREVGVFGSRIKGNARQFSDLDLVIMGDVPISNEIESKLRQAFSESNLSFRVDVLQWANASEEFKKVIETGIELFYEPGDSDC